MSRSKVQNDFPHLGGPHTTARPDRGSSPLTRYGAASLATISSKRVSLKRGGRVGRSAFLTAAPRLSRPLRLRSPSATLSYSASSSMYGGRSFTGRVRFGRELQTVVKTSVKSGEPRIAALDLPAMKSARVAASFALTFEPTQESAARAVTPLRGPSFAERDAFGFGRHVLAHAVPLVSPGPALSNSTIATAERVART